MTGTRNWLRSLKLPIVRSWRPWRSGTGQIGGYFEHYKGLTFVTVRDAGHMVCAARPCLDAKLLLVPLDACFQAGFGVLTRSRLTPVTASLC